MLDYALLLLFCKSTLFVYLTYKFQLSFSHCQTVSLIGNPIQIHNGSVWVWKWIIDWEQWCTWCSFFLHRCHHKLSFECFPCWNYFLDACIHFKASPFSFLSIWKEGMTSDLKSSLSQRLLKLLWFTRYGLYPGPFPFIITAIQHIAQSCTSIPAGKIIIGRVEAQQHGKPKLPLIKSIELLLADLHLLEWLPK